MNRQPTMSYEQRREQTIANRQRPREPDTVHPLHHGVYGGSTRAVEAKAEPNLRKANKVRQDIRDSARGEECTVQIPGACWGDVIWSHARWLHAGRAKASKAPCAAGAYACLGCDGVYDGQRPLPFGITRELADEYWIVGHFKSLVRLAEKGLL